MKAFLGRWFSLRGTMRATCWLTFAAFLFGVGWVIYQVLSPQPRWRVELADKGCIPANIYWTPDGRDVHVSMGSWEFDFGLRGHSRPTFCRTFSGALVLTVANGHEVCKFGQLEFAHLRHSPDGRFGGAFNSNRRLHFFNFDDRTESIVKYPANSHAEYSIQFSPSGKYFLVSPLFEPGDVSVFDTLTQQLIFTTSPAEPSHGTFLSDDRILLRTDGAVLTVKSFEKDGRGFDIPATDDHRATADGRRIAAWANGRVTLWDLMGPKSLRSFQGPHSGWFTPDGSKWIVGYSVYDAESGAFMFEMPSIGSLNDVERWERASPDGRFLATLFARHEAPVVVRLYDLVENRIRWEFYSEPYALLDENENSRWPLTGLKEFTAGLVDFTKDGRKLIVGIAAKAHTVFFVLDGASGTKLSQIERPCPYHDYPTQSADGRFLLLHGFPTPGARRSWFFSWLNSLNGPQKEASVSVWNLEHGGEVFAIDVDHPATVSMAPDGKSIIVASFGKDRQEILTCWDIPFARPWGWIMGLPVGIGVTVLAWKCLRRKRKVAAS